VAGSPPERNVCCMLQCNEAAFNKVKGDKKTYLWDGMGFSLNSYFVFLSGSSFNEVLPLDCQSNKKKSEYFSKRKHFPQRKIHCQRKKF